MSADFQVVNMRLTREMHDAIKLSAARSERNISQEIRWLLAQALYAEPGVGLVLADRDAWKERHRRLRAVFDDHVATQPSTAELIAQLNGTETKEATP